MHSRYAELHALQCYPLSCLNRGQYDEPKTLDFGGTVRAAISSQCGKRHWRMELEEELGEPAARTRRVPPRVIAALRQRDWPADLADFAGAQIARSAKHKGLRTQPQADHLTEAMLYQPTTQLIEDLVALCETHRASLAAALTADPKDDPGALLPTEQVIAGLLKRTATINLFGRWIAELDGADVPGAVQAAWSFTTHTSAPQPDFYTAVEDWPAPGDHGSAHMANTFHTAGVFYRYATVNLTELLHNLEGNLKATAELLTLFTKAFIMTVPQAKRTSTAPHTVPHLVHYVIRDRRPVSYADAFDQPVQAAPRGGYLAPTRRALTDHAAALDQLIGTRHRISHGYATLCPEPLKPLGTRHTSFEELAAACTASATAPPFGREPT
ncbi:type I-E CRISPR-associated protein Cas7/Cse4/CasC [Streptomyces sp. CA-132043]|uniref:type I-E CRISPR-associated protein Cas7/Cse4/CasC n=1 Tax=Streptomyces sp. CA-132043 TaxID=3240048 RepID=UPI003D8EE869